ncbi:hypothetical protein [Ruminococcus sp. FC2018]|uniref:hypothetical protein n=1 Tax=Ruminococcus sp. FC2018 TaxID=1410617 RepID=UPI001FA80968|nr:hypothetical protein [Ruminococcus sp. FC2018]
MTCLEYSDDFNTMKQEAIRRVKQMQQRSQSALGTQQDTPNTANSTAADEAAKSPDLSSLIGGLLGGGHSDGKLFDIAGIPIDEEKALIGMLIYILYKQGADIKLLLGLGYLLL